MEKRKMTAGFTLVELIVVIAILGILAGIGTVGYSGYIKKANMAADQQLVSQVKNALTLAAYSDPEFEDGIVALSLNAAPSADGLEDAMEKAFGENWADRENLRLKYDGWSATFQGSNFYSDETGLTELLGTVDTLTSALSNFLAKYGNNMTGGEAFTTYVSTMVGAEGSAAEKADAAVFYIADEVGSLDSTALQNAVAALQKPENQSSSDAALAALSQELGGSSLTSMAVLYALAEGYATYYDANDYTSTNASGQTPSDILSSFTARIGEVAGADDITTAKVFSELFNDFNQMGAIDYNALTEYLNSSVAQDLSAFSEAMKTVSTSKDSIISNNTSALGEDGYFSSAYISELLSSYAEGGIFVYVLNDNGQIKVMSSIDADKQ